MTALYDGMKLLREYTEHRCHSAGSSLGNLGGGSGSGARSDPTESEMKALTIGISISNCPDRETLEDWVNKPMDRQRIEQTRRFRIAAMWLACDIHRRLEREEAEMRSLGYDL